MASARSRTCISDLATITLCEDLAHPCVLPGEPCSVPVAPVHMQQGPTEQFLGPWAGPEPLPGLSMGLRASPTPWRQQWHRDSGEALRIRLRGNSLCLWA